LDNWDLVALYFVVFIKLKLLNYFYYFLLPLGVFICVENSTILYFVQLLLLLTLFLFSSNSCFFIRQIAIGLQIFKIFKLFPHFRVKWFSLMRPSLINQILMGFLFQVTTLQQYWSHMLLPAILSKMGANRINKYQLGFDKFKQQFGITFLFSTDQILFFQSLYLKEPML